MITANIHINFLLNKVFWTTCEGHIVQLKHNLVSMDHPLVKQLMISCATVVNHNWFFFVSYLNRLILVVCVHIDDLVKVCSLYNNGFIFSSSCVFSWFIRSSKIFALKGIRTLILGCFFLYEVHIWVFFKICCWIISWTSFVFFRLLRKQSLLVRLDMVLDRLSSATTLFRFFWCGTCNTFGTLKTWYLFGDLTYWLYLQQIGLVTVGFDGHW